MMNRVMDFFRRRNGTLAEGRKINLRRILSRDYRVMSKWFRNQELMEYAFGIIDDERVIKKISMDYYDDLINGSETAYAIETKGGLLIGFIRYTVKREGEYYGRVGILIGDRSFWGKGYGSEALNLSLSIFFKEKHLSKVELDTAMFNTRAQRCFEKCGFRKIGELTDVNFLTGEVSHKIYMRITREEFEALHRDAAGR